MVCAPRSRAPRSRAPHSGAPRSRVSRTRIDITTYDARTGLRKAAQTLKEEVWFDVLNIALIYGKCS